jgi:hypothetical protein
MNFFDWPIKKPSTEIREKKRPTSVVIASKYNPATLSAIGKQPGIFPENDHQEYEPAYRDSSTPYRDSNNSSGFIPKPLANARIVVKWIFTFPASIRVSCRGSIPECEANSRTLRFLCSRNAVRSCPNLRNDFSFLSMNHKLFLLFDLHGGTAMDQDDFFIRYTGKIMY